MPWSLKRIATLGSQLTAIVTAVVTIGAILIPDFQALMGNVFGAIAPALGRFREWLNAVLGVFPAGGSLHGYGDVGLIGFGILLILLLMYERSPIRVRAFEIWWKEQQAQIRAHERSRSKARSRRARAHKRKAA